MTVETFSPILIDDISFPPNLRDCVVAIGNFDGFHRGHRAVIDKAIEKAELLNCPAVILTFDPHPRTWFNKNNPVYILTPNSQKAELAAAFGFSVLAIHTFDKAFSSLSADEFIDSVLLEKLGARHIVIGHDFHFGTKRSGTPQYLVDRANSGKFGVTLVEACEDENGQIISSSRIRAHLEKGELAQANGLLGYTYQIQGKIIHGQKMGRKLGFPTANMSLPASVKLRHGIYAVRAIRANGDTHDGVASFGRRPTFDNGEALFETFLFDFDEDLYEQELNVMIYSWLREEMKFDQIDDLIDQMKIDKNEAAQFLSTLSRGHLRWPVGTRTDG